jgi:hypothetical protein
MDFSISEGGPMSTGSLIETLKVSSALKTPDQTLAFDTALQELALNHQLKKQDLANLFLIFDDNCADEEVMFGLVHLIEGVELQQFLESFIGVVSKLSVKAPEWTRTFHYRILNSDKARIQFRLMLPTADALSRDAIYSVLKEITREEETSLSTHAEYVLECFENI